MTRDDAFYWEGLAVRELRVRVCDDCGRGACPPRPGCPHCGGERGRIVVSSGEGRLYTWTVCHVAFDEDFAGEVPYIVGVVELPEGARIVARIEAIGPEALRDEVPLRVRWPEGRGAAAAGDVSATSNGANPDLGQRLVFVPVVRSGGVDG